MPVYKDEKKGTWYVKRRYKGWDGEIKNLMKRGFALKRDAIAWETEFMEKLSGALDMSFESFADVYKRDKDVRLKDSTWETKNNMLDKHIIPYFRNKAVREITSVDVIHWQNEMMKKKTEDGKRYSPTFLRSVHSQLSAVFNHAVRFYGLKENPAQIAGAMGESESNEMKIWSTEEYKKFSEAIMDKPLSFYVFEVLYWTGIRKGELLALTPADFDLDKGTLSVTKTLHRKNGEDVITSPKTPQSIRIVAIPKFLCDELKDYFKMVYDLDQSARAFPISSSFLSREMVRGSKLADVPQIRIHDLRHSHVSLLIQMGYSAVAIGKRVGHKSIDITFRYAHLFPNAQADMMSKLDEFRKEENGDER